MPTSPLDFHALFDASPNAYLVLDRSLNIVGANRAYLASTQRRLEDIVGRWAWDAFPTDLQTLGHSVASFERVLRTGEPDTMPLLRFDIPRADTDGGGFEKRYWSITHTPVRDAQGEVAFVLQHPVDVTDLERERGKARAEGPGAVEPVHSQLLDRARNAQAMNLQLHAQAGRLRELFAQAPAFMAIVAGPEHRFELTNRAFQQLIGEREVTGLPAREALPELAQAQVMDALEQAYARGEPFIGRGIELDIQHRPGQASETRVVDFVYQPIRGSDGAVSGLFIVGNDVTEAARSLHELKRNEEQLRLVIEGAKDHAIVTLDPEGVITHWSPGAAAIFGWPAQEAVGQPIAMIFTPEDRAAGIDRHELDTAARLGQSADLRWHVTRQGLRVFMNGTVYRLPPQAGGGPRGFLKIARDETARRAADEALAASEEQFRVMANAVPQIIWVANARGEVEFMNRQWSLYTGSATPPTVPQVAAQHLHPDDAGPTVEAFDRARQDGSAYRVEHRIRSADGQWRWFSVHGAPVRDATTGEVTRWVGTSVDIHDRKLASDALERTAQWQAFVVQLSDLIGGLADPGSIQRTALDLVAQRLGTDRALYGEYTPPRGFVREEFRRGALPALVGDYAMSDFPQLHETLRSGRELVVADLATCGLFGEPERERLQAMQLRSLLVFPRVKGGRLVASLVLGNQAPRAWTELELTLGRETAERTWAAVERARAEAALRAADRRKDEFLATLAHELRNPLAPLRTGIHLARLSLPGDSRLHKTLAMMDRQMTHLVRLVDDLLDVGRITSGKLVLARAPIALDAVLAASVESVQSLIDLRGHALTQVSCPEPLQVRGDFDRLAQVFINLLTNAAKYTPPAGHITLSLACEPGTAVVRVTDDGIGIPQESLAQVFDLFSQVGGHDDRADGGLGIGLSLVRTIVAMHEGTVSVRSEGPGHGSTFEVRLPLLDRASPQDKEPPCGVAP